MELFADVIRGPYAFLLILQILIVSGLMLSLCWLVLQRVRGGSMEEMTSESAPATVDTAIEQAATSTNENSILGETILPETDLGEPVVDTAPAVAVAPSPEPVADTVPQAPAAQASVAPERQTSEAVPPPSGQVTELLNEKERENKALADEGAVLKDKIKYLESRLMEYEIVQEEISNLSQLRVENERLKEELLQFQVGKRPTDGEGSGGGAAGGTGTPPASTPSEGSPPQGAAASSAETQLGPMDTVPQSQIDSILKKLDDITAKA